MRKQRFLKLTKETLWKHYRKQVASVAMYRIRVAHLATDKSWTERNLESKFKQKYAEKNSELLAEILLLKRENEFLRGRLGELPDGLQSLFDQQVPKPESPLFLT